MKGIVSDILHGSLNDGDGIRTTVFLKGCPLRCVWCHNPETQEFSPELIFNPSLCVSCGECERICPQNAVEDGAFDRYKCIKCFECVSVCVTDARKRCGKEMTVHEVMDEVCRDERYFKAANGGITISGGEPFFQPYFTLELLKLAKNRGIDTCVETCGQCPTCDILAAVPYTDLFIFDFKEDDAEKHKTFTGVSNGKIKENLFALSDSGANIILSCPIIPEYNLSDGHFKNIALLSSEIKCLKAIKLLPYHPLGADKAESLGRKYLPSRNYPSNDEIALWYGKLREELSKINLDTKVI